MDSNFKTTCETCGNADFELKDGYFFCSVCQTQSQDIREEEAGEEVFKPSQRKLTIHARAEAKQKVDGKDDGKKLIWTTNDCFSIILKKMVDILVKMGASAQLKDVVKQLWFGYLQKTQYAFCSKANGKEWIPKLSVLPRERDVQIINDCSLVIKAKKFRRTYLHTMKNKIARKKRKALTSLRGLTPSKKRNKSGKTTTDESDVDDVKDSILTSASEYDDTVSLNAFDLTSLGKNKTAAVPSTMDNSQINLAPASPNSEPSSVHSTKFNVDRKKVYSKKQYNKHALQLKRRSKRTQQESITRMTMARVLEFLYLGLILVDNQILLCDLLRWIRESWLPLREAAHLLPTDFDFETYDTMTFRLLELPDNKIVRSKTARLATFLGINMDNMPTKSIQEIAARFILDLKLPCEFHRLINNLALAHPVQFSVKCFVKNGTKKIFSIPNYEGRALAFIIVILKLLFGLDGASERKQDQYSRKLSELLPDVNPFIWEEWRNYITCRHRLLQKNFIFECADEPEKCSDIDQLVGYYIENQLKAKGRMSSRRARRYRTCKEEITDSVRHSLKSIVEIKNSYPLLGTVPTSFPYSSREKKLLAESVNLQQPDLKTVDFRKKTIGHLIHPERFRTDIEKKGAELEINVSLWKLSSGYVKKKRSSTEAASDNQLTTPVSSSDSDFETDQDVKKKATVKLRSVQCSDDEISVTQHSKKGKCKDAKNTKCSTSKSSSSMKLHVYQPYREYSIEHYRRNEHGIYAKLSSEFSSSLRWLVDMLSIVGGMKAETLYEELMLVERVLIHTTLSNTFRKHLVDTLW